MRDFREGSDTTMTAVHISAVHQRSGVVLVRGAVEVVIRKGQLTSVGVIDIVVHVVHDESSETDRHGKRA